MHKGWFIAAAGICVAALALGYVLLSSPSADPPAALPFGQPPEPSYPDTVDWAEPRREAEGTSPDDPDSARYRLDRSVILPPLRLEAPEQTLPPVDPDDPESAAAGRQL